MELALRRAWREKAFMMDWVVSRRECKRQSRDSIVQPRPHVCPPMGTKRSEKGDKGRCALFQGDDSVANGEFDQAGHVVNIEFLHDAFAIGFD